MLEFDVSINAKYKKTEPDLSDSVFYSKNLKNTLGAATLKATLIPVTAFFTAIVTYIQL